MIYTVRHVTEVRYSSIVQLARFNLRLRPAEWPGQRLMGYSLSVSPRPGSVVESSGPFVVNNSRIMLTEPIRQLRIVSQFRVEKLPQADPDMAASPSVAQVRSDALAWADLSPSGPAAYLFASQIVRMEPEIGAWARGFFTPADPVLAAASAVMQAIYRDFSFDAKATETGTPPIEAFRQKRGVCQDFAQIMIAALRANGIPAAYVSGYLRTIPPAGKPRLIGADATHAWVHAWCGEALGWVGFDPTNNSLARGDHIFTAMGRDYADVSPIDGVFYGATDQLLKVSVDVMPETVLVGM